MKFNGERVVPSDADSHLDTYQQHMVRYLWAMTYCKGKNVIDAACGTGYGSQLLSLITKRIDGFDIDDEALDYARTYYDDCASTRFHKVNLNDNEPVLFHSDVIVSFETIEHLDDPSQFLKWCKRTAPLVIGSIPINCPTPFHKHNYSFNEAVTFIRSHFPEAELFVQDEMNIFSWKEGQLHSENGMILFIGRR